MERVLCCNLTNGKTQLVRGFVENLRNRKKMAFIVLKDVSGRIQITLEKEKNPSLVEVVDRITIGSVISVKGLVVASEYVKMGQRELIPDDITIDSLSEPLPIAPGANIDTRMDYRWIDLRTDKNVLMMKVQTEMVALLRQHVLKHGFIEIHSPKLIGAASESGADVFELTYFDRKAYLAQSPQFYKQMAMAAGLERVFEVAPVFRAEKSFTHRHATEFTSFDIEISYIESFEDVMCFQQDMLLAMLKGVKEKYGNEIETLFGLPVTVPTIPFPTIRLEDLYKELEARYGYKVGQEEKVDLSAEAEKLSYQFSMDAYQHEFLFITDYPKDKRAFYHMRKDGVPQGYDLIWRGTEITTGAQREHRYNILKQQAHDKGLEEDVKFYLDFFRYGCPPHGGFGMGIDRLTMLMFDLGIKEASFLFRGPNRITP
ncbi:MAG: aspartate--tRNA(Asn) ligase [Christensenellales bacterium]|jgi:nondiscriminating aspartyl-tRNA synthetase